MTREEHISNLETIGCDGWTVTTDAYKSLQFAIKALEQEPYEDVIDRAEAMTEIMMFAGNVKSDEEDIYIKVSDAVQLLRELPPVNPQPKTGHWIFDEILDKHYYCSECKSMGVDYWDYCPNCGSYNGGD